MTIIRSKQFNQLCSSMLRCIIYVLEFSAHSHLPTRIFYWQHLNSFQGKTQFPWHICCILFPFWTTFWNRKLGLKDFGQLTKQSDRLAVLDLSCVSWTGIRDRERCFRRLFCLTMYALKQRPVTKKIQDPVKHVKCKVWLQTKKNSFFCYVYV